jgi:hypothetical protein
MITKPLANKLPSLPLDVDAFWPDGPLLKAYLCGCVLPGGIASEEEGVPIYDDEALAERAYRLGEFMFEKYSGKNLSAVRKFNEKVWL